METPATNQPGSVVKPADSVVAPIKSDDTTAEKGWFNQLVSPSPENTPAPIVSQIEPKIIPAPADSGKPEVKAEQKPDEKAIPTESEKLEKRLKDTRDALTQERQRNLQLNQAVLALGDQMKTLTAKVDGTYDETKENAQDPAKIAAQADFYARVEASNEAAIELLMAQSNLSREEAETKVVETIWTADGPYQTLERENVQVKERVAKAKAPVLEAFKVLRERDQKSKYGDTPEAMKAAIEKELRATLVEQITKEVTEKLKGDKKPDGYKPLVGVGEVPGSGKVDGEPAKGDNFSSLFPMFPKKF